jgi:hypothetical protein
VQVPLKSQPLYSVKIWRLYKDIVKKTMHLVTALLCELGAAMPRSAYRERANNARSSSEGHPRFGIRQLLLYSTYVRPNPTRSRFTSNFPACVASPRDFPNVQRRTLPANHKKSNTVLSHHKTLWEIGAINSSFRV